MGAQNIMTRVVLRQTEDYDGPSLDTYVMQALGGDVEGVLVTRESDGEDRLICGEAMHIMLDQYVVMKEVGLRAPDGVLWCDARDQDDGMAKALVSLFILSADRVTFEDSDEPMVQGNGFDFDDLEDEDYDE